MTEDEVDRFIASNSWKFASSMPHIPHWYCLRSRTPDSGVFSVFVSHIRSIGVARTFWGKQYIYLDHGEYSYWTMGAPVEDTVVINRTTRQQ